MKNPKRKAPFIGAGTALATPFSENGIDFPALGAMIDYQIGAGIDALVLCGTTGESVTLTEKEYDAVTAFAAEKIHGRVPYLVGCGSADTAKAAAHAKIAHKNGADALLVVTPYYNKGNPDGIVRHYHLVADVGNLPLLLYHVPARTGVRLRVDTVCRIAEHPLVCGIKEASGDMEFFAALAAALRDTLTLYSGCDALILPSLSLGGGGVISVVSNLYPAQTAQLCRLYAEGDTEAALAMQLRLLPLIQLLFSDINPAPLKCALALRGMCNGRLRLPLAPVSHTLEEQLAQAMRAFE